MYTESCYCYFSDFFTGDTFKLFNKVVLRYGLKDRGLQSPLSIKLKVRRLKFNSFDSSFICLMNLEI